MVRSGILVGTLPMNYRQQVGGDKKWSSGLTTQREYLSCGKGCLAFTPWPHSLLELLMSILTGKLFFWLLPVLREFPFCSLQTRFWNLLVVGYGWRLSKPDISGVFSLRALEGCGTPEVKNSWWPRWESAGGLGTAQASEWAAFACCDRARGTHSESSFSTLLCPLCWCFCPSRRCKLHYLIYSYCLFHWVDSHMGWNCEKTNQKTNPLQNQPTL